MRAGARHSRLEIALFSAGCQSHSRVTPTLLRPSGSAGLVPAQVGLIMPERPVEFDGELAGRSTRRTEWFALAQLHTVEARQSSSGVRDSIESHQ